MPVESTNTIDGLNTSWPLGGEGVSEGDDHLRQEKSVLKNIFPGLSGNGFSVPITATEDELNKLAGMTSSTAELNILTGVTSTAAELNILTGVTKTPAEVNAFLIPDEIVNLIYPVGAIYCSAASTDPSTVFGVGTWTPLADKQTLVQQGTYAAGSSGGSSTAVLVSHTHTQAAHTHNYLRPTVDTSNARGQDPGTGVNNATTVATTSANPAIGTAGVSGANANMPPYLSVFMWQRTA